MIEKEDIPHKTKVVKYKSSMEAVLMKPRFMKNVLGVFVPVLLCGCTPEAGTEHFEPKLDPAYTVEAHLEYADSAADLTLKRKSEGVWDAEFSAPNTLAGVTLSFDGNAVGASYQGLQFTVPKSAMPAKTVLVTVTGVLDAVAGERPLLCTAQEDGTWQYAGAHESVRYTVTFDAAGQLAGMELPDQPAKLRFQAYTVSAAETAPAASTTVAAESSSAVTSAATTTANTSKRQS